MGISELEDAIKLLSVYKKRYTKYEVIITKEELHTLNKENFNYEVSEAIDIVLKELDNRIPREKIEIMSKKINSELAMCRSYKANQIIIETYFNKLLNKE